MNLREGLRWAVGCLALAGHPPADSDLDDWLDWAFDQLDPRLRTLNGDRRAYLHGLGHALAYCQSLATQVPGPVTVERQAFAQDPLVHALFGSADGIAQALVRSQAVKAWLHDHPGITTVYAMLGVRRQEKQVLGMTLEHGALQREVPQTVTYFSDQTFSNLAVSPEDTRALLVRQFMASLLGRVKDRIEAAQARRQALERERDELRARLRGCPGDAGLRAGLNQVLADLAQAIHELDLQGYSRHFNAVMEAPEAHVQLNMRTVRIDPMGVCLADAAACHTDEIQLHEMVCRDRRKWNVMVVRCRLDEVPAYAARLEEVERWLVI